MVSTVDVFCIYRRLPFDVVHRIGNELFSDVYPVKERDGVFYEVTGKVSVVYVRRVEIV